MAKKEFKRIGKRGLAMFLTLVMTISMLQLPALAAGFQDQVMDGWYQLNENNEIVDTTDEEIREELGFQLSKSIEQTGENAFGITLKVVTTETVTTSDAAIQLVIDTSSSMQYCATCGKQTGGGFGATCTDRNHTDTRLEAIQDILASDNGFLDALASANTGKVYVSVVTYGQGAEAKVDWMDIKIKSNLDSMKNTIKGLKATDNATNMHAGLMLARNRLDMDVVSNTGTKFTILLSDGFANCVGGESSSTTSIRLSGSSPSSADATTAGTNGAKAMAEAVGGKSTVYAVGYGVDKQYLSNIIGGDDNVFVGADSASVSAAFADIARSTTEGMNGGGTKVTDPMGQFIVLGDVTALNAEGLQANGSTLTWALDPVNADKQTSGNVTTYTYEITYPITLDTAAEGFEENKYYPTNGYTYLSVSTDGGVKKLPFNVPGVCGEIPEENWEIEYYLQGDAEAGDYDSYILDDSAVYGPVKVWSSVYVPEGYEGKYAEQYYSFVSGQTQMQVVPAGENVIRLYYDHIMVPVTVNHYYKTDAILPTGEEVFGSYPESPDKTEIEYVKVTSDYTAEIETVFGGAEYELERVDPSIEIVAALTDSNVIDLYYTRLDDQRVITGARVDHVYTTYAYEIEGGEYVLKEKASVTETAEQATSVRATTMFNVDSAPLAGYEDFELNAELGDYEALVQSNGTLGFIVVEEPADNIRTLYYELVIDEREDVQVTVNHHYNKTVTTIEDGEIVTNEYNSQSVEGYEAYKGESFTAVEINELDGDEYISDPGNEAKLHIDALTGDVEIDLYYTLVEIPEQTGIIINHYWRTFTDVTVEKTEEIVDPLSGEITTVVVGTEIVERETLDHSIEGIEVDELYVGQKYIAAKQSWGEGYTFNEGESNPTIIVGDEYVIDLYYDRFDDTDERSDADIDVIHNYTTYLTTVIDGQVDTLTLADGSESEVYEELKAGDEFAAQSVTEYNGNEYERITADEALSTVLQPGTNSAIVIHYEREISDLVDTAYQVDYEYRTYTMTVNESGVAGYWNAPAVELGESVSGSGYVGQRIEIASGEQEGFAPLASNPAVVQYLTEGENVYTFVYEQYIPLQTGTVTVNHSYKITTIAIDGTSSVSESSVLGAPVTKYEGELVKAETIDNGFELVSAVVDGIENELASVIDVTVSGDIVVDFSYEKVIDNSVLTRYTIAHIYNLYTWDGELISSSEPAPVEGEGYATTRISADPEPNHYELVESSCNGEELAAPYTIVLQEGENDIVFVYEKYLPREMLDVKVIHNYYRTESAVGAEAPLSVYEESVNGIPEDSDYTAEQRVAEGFRFFSAQPEELTITVVKGGENVIIINYIRQSASYSIVHKYLCNDELEAVVCSEEISGFVGDEIKGDSITRETSYEGNSYQFDSISEDIVLEADVVNIITLTYKRTVYIPEIPEEPEVPETPEEPAVPELPEIKFPEIPMPELPEIKFPEFSLPELPEIKFPEISLPELPEIKFPEFSLPELPEIQFPEISLPELPEIEFPEISVPELPEIKFPEISLPELPEIEFPEISLPELPEIPEAPVIPEPPVEPEQPELPVESEEDEEDEEDEEPEQSEQSVEPEQPAEEIVIEMPDEDVPLAEIPEEIIPLADVPKTGEEMIYRILAAASGVSLLALAFAGRKKEEDLA